jgi:hypothetical protein
MELRAICEVAHLRSGDARLFCYCVGDSPLRQNSILVIGGRLAYRDDH